MGTSPPSSSPPLTLVVATTRSMGIGRGGTLPWPRLKSEIAYFSRVTKRAPPPPPSPPATTSSSSSSSSPRRAVNAVIMGRKTWESIPEAYRPLKQRLNMIISRQARDQIDGVAKHGTDMVDVATSLELAVEKLVSRYGHQNNNIDSSNHGSKDGAGEKEEQAPVDVEEEQQASVDIKEERMPDDTKGNQQTPDDDATKEEEVEEELGRVFIIGGADIYRAALDLGSPTRSREEGGRHRPWVQRILWTAIQTDFECDTFFPVDLNRFSDGHVSGWTKKSTEELRHWTGQDDIGETRVEDGVEYRICMLERDN